MTAADETARYCADLVAGCADAGVDIVFISPGSRNTPLTLAFVSEPRIRDISIRDERSAGFAAVGFAKATGRPAVVVCTSGSAATHYFPAVVEADQSATPMIVLTADRPERLRGTGAPQTMDQLNLYGNHVKTFTDIDVGGQSGRRDGDLLVSDASQIPAGPVHANVALDEPLVADSRTPPSEPAVPSATGSPGAPGGGLLDGLAGANVLVVASGRQQPGFGDALNRVAAALRAPVIADPQCWVTGPNTIDNGDLLAGRFDRLDSIRPDIVLRLGPVSTSKPLWSWLERSGIEQVLVQASRLTDPLDSATTTFDCDPTDFLEANVPSRTADSAFLDAWRSLDHAASVARDGAMAVIPFPNEPQIARTLMETVRSGTLVFVGSSMPIRDIDAFADPRSDIIVCANRGVNGIDGVVSSALGASLAGSPVTLFLGDVSALHDATAMSEIARIGAPVRIVVVNNDGGGIFSFLPQATSELVGGDTFEKHWGTPHGLSLAKIASGMGLRTSVVDSLAAFDNSVAAPLDTPELIELFTNRDTNVTHHRAIREAVESVI